MTMQKRDLNVRVARWALQLDKFEYTIKHRPGKNMLHVDALSRNPIVEILIIDDSPRRAHREDTQMQKLIDKVESETRKNF